MTGVATQTCLAAQMDELQAKYRLLRLEYSRDGNPLVQGTLRFAAHYDGKAARGEYDIRICIPDDYPRDVPSVYETGGRLPEGFHKYTDSSLCLGAPAAVKKKFLESPTLLGFVENLVIPLLFSHAYFAQRGEMPFGELPHGIPGLVDFYNEFFGTDLPATMKLLKILADGRRRYKSYFSCPCQSERPLSQCHGPKIEQLWAVMDPQDYAKELGNIVAWCERAFREIEVTQYLPHKAMRKRKAKRRKVKPR